uniref:Tudor domain-containing protein n=1 Tax=Monopterus albus TaxID=43700 RepID=A0A3Q3K5Y2_MONAL|nr:tudor domain-containing protein 6-like isoform X2 [Monopterus albus]
MSSVIGLPAQGSHITILITRVNLHPLCVLVEFWGNFRPEQTAEYECLAKDIQSPGNAFQEFEGTPGDQCLVQIDGTWHRSRIVSKNGSKYSMYLIDKGMTSSTTTNKLAWGKKAHFHLLPEVEFCVLANVLPLSPENRWSPVALEFLRSFTGKSVKAHVQDVLVPHRTLLLHIPCISKQMYEMGFAKKLSPDMFHDFVHISLLSPSGAEVSTETQLSMREVEQLHKQVLFMYPELPAGAMETVIVTEVTNPQQIFCQLKVFSLELRKLSEQLTQCCEGRMASCTVGPEMVGFPCAAKGNDGRWYRSVLQKVFPTNKVVEVLNVDYGTKQFVHVKNIRPLAGEFFRMPVVTYLCSLHGIIDKGVGWKASQIDNLRTLLLCKTVIAKFEYRSISEGVYYVTLYGHENTNLNILFGAKESSLLQCETSLVDYALCSTAYGHRHPNEQERIQRKMLTPGKTGEEKEGNGVLDEFPAEELPLNSSHMAIVQHVSNPSEFWIQTQNYAIELEEVMDSINHLYEDSDDLVRNPNVGLYCAAKAKDGDFYRATVSEVGEMQIKVFFVDYGITEVVDRLNIRILPEKLKMLPRLALKCTLAGVRPKDASWSQGASEFFIKAVTDKELNIHVIAKHDGSYVVQLTDPKAKGESDLSTLMCNANLAERAETHTQPKAKMTMHPAILSLAEHPDARISGVYRNSGISFQTQNTHGPPSNENNPTFKEFRVPIGSFLDVNVSCIISPNDFWCQLVQNAGHLQLLMHDIQAHYEGSEFQAFAGTACVARHPDNKMWYRTLVLKKHETPHVDVLFVDYGQTKTVSLYDLRKICPDLLTLPGQAFRCSLINPLNPLSVTNEWHEEALARFHNFVKSATSNFVILKCTIYAVMYSEQKHVYNVVDLETPFESVSNSMVNLVQSTPPKRASGPSFHLDTYCYSTHNVKTGTEEQVTVTCVNSVSHFFCQLERNADILKDLKIKVSDLCHQIQNVILPTVFGTLCFAKYTDGQWYRGQIKATKPAILVHFVDYGDTIEVDKSDLLPVPREASDIMSVPVQAVVCSLSDVPASVSSEVNSWFETCATERKFRALVVAREPDGKLLVELYHRNTQINSKIKKVFPIEMYTEERVVYQRQKSLEASAKHAQKIPKASPKQATEMEVCVKKSSVSVLKPAHRVKDELKFADLNLQSVPKPLHHICENLQKGKPSPFEMYRPPHQRTQSGSEPTGALVTPRENLTTDAEQLINSRSLGPESQKESNAEKLPKLADLPSKSITVGMKADVYISHCNSPLSFYVQLVKEEGEILSISESLNDSRSTPKTSGFKDVHPGDVVQAEFEDDSSWYRAVVREIHTSTMALVEFVDFGNTAMMPISKIWSLPKSLLQLPVYSMHCMLSSAAALAKEEVLDPEVVSTFKEDIGGNGEKVLKCTFVRKSGSVWEVSLEDGDVHVMCRVPTRCSNDGSEIVSEKLEQVGEEPVQNSDIGQLLENSAELPLNLCSLHYYQQEFLEGQQLEAYITSINDVQNIWCQCADSEELDKITLTVSDIGTAADHKCVDPGFLSPGSPCIALFSDDHLWYRAKVIDKDGDSLSVLFVDYGNKSQVNIRDVREMAPDLVETPPQAFLCKLEGFDSSCGYWDSGAVDELYTLTADKLLQLTITRVARDEEKIKCFVQMQCDGHVINEVMKTWWKSSTTENTPDAVRLMTSYEIPLQCDSAVEEAALPEDQLEYLESQEMDTAVTHIHPLIDPSEEQLSDEVFDLHTANEVKLAGSPKTRKPPEDSVHLQSFAESPKEEREQNLSEYDMAVGSQESVSTEVLNIVPAMVINRTKPKEILSCDSVIEETMPSPLNKVDQGCDKNVSETDKGSEEKGASVMDTIGPDDLNSLLDENFNKATDKSEFATTDLDSSVEEMNIGGSFDMVCSAPSKDSIDSEIVLVRDSSPTRVATPQMIQAKLLPSPVIPAQQLSDASREQEIEAGDGIPQEALPCVTSHIKIDLMTEEETLAHHEVHSIGEINMEKYKQVIFGTSSSAFIQKHALLADIDTAASKPRACTVPPPDMDEEVACFVEEACLTDVCTVSNEPSDNVNVTSAREVCLSRMTAEQMVQSKSFESPENEMEFGDPSVQTEAIPNKGNSMTEVEEGACLTEIYRDPLQEAGTVDSEQLVHTPPKQKERHSCQR